MSGKRHHYIPQFLQRGFASHFSGKDAYTWVYRKNNLNPFNTNIKNVGLEGFFYSEDKESDLDDLITQSENVYSLFIEQLRGMENLIDEKNSARAAEFIAHLEARTKNIRTNFQNASQYFIEEISKFLSSPENCKKFISSQVKNQADALMEVELKKSSIPSTLYPIFKQKMKQELANRLPLMEQSMNLAINILNQELSNHIEKSAKNGHIKALLNSHIPEIKVSRYKKLKFELVTSSEIPLPLGDSGVIFYSDKKFKPFLDKSDTLKAAILPISSSKFLIGTSEELLLGIDEIVNGIAACSSEYFISSNNDDVNNKLTKLISNNTSIINEEDIHKIINDLIN